MDLEPRYTRKISKEDMKDIYFQYCDRLKNNNRFKHDFSISLEILHKKSEETTSKKESIEHNIKKVIQMMVEYRLSKINNYSYTRNTYFRYITSKTEKDIHFGWDCDYVNVEKTKVNTMKKKVLNDSSLSLGDKRVILFTEKFKQYKEDVLYIRLKKLTELENYIIGNSDMDNIIYEKFSRVFVPNKGRLNIWEYVNNIKLCNQDLKIQLDELRKYFNSTILSLALAYQHEGEYISMKEENIRLMEENIRVMKENNILTEENNRLMKENKQLQKKLNKKDK